MRGRERLTNGREREARWQISLGFKLLEFAPRTPSKSLIQYFVHFSFLHLSYEISAMLLTLTFQQQQKEEEEEAEQLV